MKSYRKDKVASLVRQVVGTALVHDVRDPRVSPLTTVSRVEITPDMLVAKVFLSVSGSDADARRTLAGVRSAAGYLQRKVASSLTMRHCPELQIEIDPHIKNTREMMELLDENRRREPEIFETDTINRLTEASGSNANPTLPSTAPTAPTTPKPNGDA